MRAVIQRVSKASVSVADEVVGSIDRGLLILLGVGVEDTPNDADVVAAKIAGLRIFGDDEGKMNRSVGEAGGEVLVVSQFTLYGDVRKGKRPSFVGAARPEDAAPLVERFVDRLREDDITVARGRFGASMQVSLVNEGPVTIIVESAGGRLL